MPTSDAKKPKPRKQAEELFYEEDGRRADAALHESILAEGDEATARAVSDKVAQRLIGRTRPKK